MDVPLDFDSDDFVSSEDEAVLNPFFDVGKKKIEKMLEFAREDRIASKRRMKNLRDLSGTPGQARQRQLWFNYFQAFVGDILGHDIRVTPTGDLVCRFVCHIIERLESKIIGKPAYSKNSLEDGLRKLTRRLTFEYPTFNITEHYKLRIEAAVGSLVREGKLTVGNWRKSQWIGFLTLRSLLVSYVKDGLANGVTSWDVRISRWLSIVLQSSADSRAGEVVRSDNYDGEEFMKWEDVEVKLVGGTQFEHLQAQATILWEKGSKDDKSYYRKVRWRPLEQTASIIVDPICVLLIHALRNGQVYGRTIDEVLEHAAAQPSGKIFWVNPTWPIIPAITNLGVALDFSRPANVQQLGNSIREVGRIGGSIHELSSHDLRRGSAKDLKHIENLAAGVDRRVASAMGHSDGAFRHGTTEKYAERESLFVLNQKEKSAERVGEDPFGLQIAPTPYRRPIRLRSQDIDAAAKKYPGLSRRKLTKRVHEDLEEKWREEALKPAMVVPQKRLCVENKSRSALSMLSKNTSVSSQRMGDVDLDAVQTVDVAYHLDAAKDANIDPELLPEEQEEAYRLLRVVRADATESERDDPLVSAKGRQTDDAEDNLFIEAVFSTEDPESPLQKPVLPFIDFFARINIVLKTKPYTADQLIALGHSTGNSRDPPTQFVRSCVNEELGCGFQSPSMNTLDIHEACKCIYRDGASEEERLARSKPRTWSCSRCARTFLRKRFLRVHERFGHNESDPVTSEPSWEPRACDRGCKTGYVFATEHRYRDHCYTKHPTNPTFTPQPCQLKDACGHENDFTTASQYRRHLSKYHRLDKEQREAYFPRQRRPFKIQPCPLGNCPVFEKDIPDRSHLLRHLVGVHHRLSEDEARRVTEGEVLDRGDETTPPSNASETSPGYPCPIGKCNYAHKGFSARKDLKRHLTSGQHHCSDEEANRLSGINVIWSASQKASHLKRQGRKA